jgi:filamentous hemagglutinin
MIHMSRTLPGGSPRAAGARLQWARGGQGFEGLKQIYDFLEDAPNYPEDFYPTPDGTRKLKVKNQFLLAELRSVEAGEWRKVYQDGYSRGELVSVHYFESRSGRVFDVKVKSGWSNSVG